MARYSEESMICEFYYERANGEWARITDLRDGYAANMNEEENNT